MALRAFVLAPGCFCACAWAQTWPIPYETSVDTLPTIEVHLAPPVHPLPQVAAEIALLDRVREGSEEEKMSQFELAFNQAIESAKQQIGDVVGEALRMLDNPQTGKRGASTTNLSFLQQRQDSAEEPSVKIKALAAAPPDPAIKSKIDGIEEQRATAEVAMLDTAIVEMGELTKIVVAELEKQVQLQLEALLASSSSFLGSQVQQTPGSPEGLPKQLNVRVGASDIPYPTIAALVQDMESRRDTAENLIRARILELELKLLKVENAMIKGALEVAVGRVLAQHATRA